jgi:hypothetical protein
LVTEEVTVYLQEGLEGILARGQLAQVLAQTEIQGLVVAVVAAQELTALAFASTWVEVEAA